jgi:TolA-binding protein
MMKSLKAFLALAALASTPLLTGCALETRNGNREQEERQVLRKQVTTLQATTADVNARFQDLEDGQRRLQGRIEAMELQSKQSGSASSKTQAAAEQRMKEIDAAYREEFIKMRTEIDGLKSQLSEMQEGQRRSSQAAAASAAASEKDPFASAEDKFGKKAWREAILDYQRYRKDNPKGKQFSTATYKIGASFQELGMVDEARAFYEEVVSKFPKSKDATRANAKLKALKK